MNKKALWTDPDVHMKVRTHIDMGDVLLGESDTVIGLFAPATEQGVKVLNRIKGRKDKPYIILVASIDQAWQFAATPEDAAVQRLVACWPAPLTLIFKAHETLPPALQSPDNTVAIRIPDHGPLRALALDCGGLLSTSANKAGLPIPDMLSTVAPEIKAAVAIIIHNESTSTMSTTASTIVDCTKKPAHIIRAGLYDIKAIKNILDIDK
jgi:L-threonylcarbamoyladenylate synthase